MSQRYVLCEPCDSPARKAEAGWWLDVADTDILDSIVVEAVRRSETVEPFAYVRRVRKRGDAVQLTVVPTYRTSGEVSESLSELQERDWTVDVELQRDVVLRRTNYARLGVPRKYLEEYAISRRVATTGRAETLGVMPLQDAERFVQHTVYDPQGSFVPPGMLVGELRPVEGRPGDVEVMLCRSDSGTDLKAPSQDLVDAVEVASQHPGEWVLMTSSEAMDGRGVDAVVADVGAGAYDGIDCRVLLARPVRDSKGLEVAVVTHRRLVR